MDPALLEPGLYTLTTHDGTEYQAAVGIHLNGQRWFIPTSSNTPEDGTCLGWGMIASAKKINLDGEVESLRQSISRLEASVAELTKKLADKRRKEVVKVAAAIAGGLAANQHVGTNEVYNRKSCFWVSVAAHQVIDEIDKH